MTDIMPPTTTATQLQRNYKQVVSRAKKLQQPIVILANNQPQGVYIDYELYKSQTNLQASDQGNKKYTARKRKTLDQLYGSWSKEQAESFDKIIDDNFEKIDPESWKQG